MSTRELLQRAKEIRNQLEKLDRFRMDPVKLQKQSARLTQQVKRLEQTVRQCHQNNKNLARLVQAKQKRSVSGMMTLSGKTSDHK